MSSYSGSCVWNERRQRINAANMNGDEALAERFAVIRVALQRTGAEFEIDLPVTVTPLGVVTRLEHALDGFEDERERNRHRLDDARRRLTSYRSRLGGEFAFAGEPAEKLRQVAEDEKSLSQEVDAPPLPAKAA